MESKKEEVQDKKDQPPQSDQPTKTEPNTSTIQTNQSQITKSSKPKKIQYLNQKGKNLQIFCLNHNKIIDLCVNIKIEILQLINSLKNKNNNKNENSNTNFCYDYNSIQKSVERTFIFLNEIGNSIQINIKYLSDFSISLKNYDDKIKNTLKELIIENENYYKNINNIIIMYMSIVNTYMIILNKK